MKSLAIKLSLLLGIINIWFSQGCSKTEPYELIVQFPTSSSDYKQATKTLSIYSVITAGDTSTCTDLISGFRKPGDDGYLEEDKEEISSPFTENVHPLKISKKDRSNRLLFIEGEDGDGNKVLRGCTEIKPGDQHSVTVSLMIVYPTAVADFIATPLVGLSPLTVQFTDNSLGTITSWAWDFDNNGMVDSTVQNPAWIYNTPGTYTVKLHVEGVSSSDDELKSQYITVSTLKADFVADVVEGDTPLTVNFTNISSGDLTSATWAWDFGDGGTSTSQTPSHTYTNEGKYTVNLTVTNTYGSNTEIKSNYIYSKGYHGLKSIDVSSTNESLTGQYPVIAVDGKDIYITYYEKFFDPQWGANLHKLNLAISHDNGFTWPVNNIQEVLGYWTDFFGETGLYPSLVLSHEGTDDSLFIATESASHTSQHPYYSFIDFIKSIDSGTTWSRCAAHTCVKAIVNQDFLSMIFQAFRPTLKKIGNTLYCGYYKQPEGSSNYSIGYAISLDNGDTWLTANQYDITPSLSMFSHTPMDIVEDTIDGNNIYICFNSLNGLALSPALSLKKSTDNGLTWQTTYDIDYYSSISQTSISVVKGNSNNLDNIYIVYFAGNYFNLARSVNGSSFQKINIEMVSVAGTECPSIKTIKDNSNGDDIYISYTANGALKFARSLDGGDTWTIKTIDANTDCQYSSLAVNGDNVYITYYRTNSLWFAKSIDGGASW